MNRTLIAAIGLILAFCIGIFFYAEWQKREFDASLPEPPAPTQVQAAETETETEGGHWHGDEWHAEPHTVHAEENNLAVQRPKRLPVKGLKNPTREQLVEANRHYYESQGLKVPPKGYHYIWDGETEEVLRDENGDPLLLNEYEPYMEWSTIQGFAPTREQWERYQQLQFDLSEAEYRQDTNEVQRIRDEMAQIEANAQGELPSISSGLWVVPQGEDPEAFDALMLRKLEEAQQQAYRDMGLEYLLP